MATAWDRHSAASLSKMQDARVREQVQHVVAPFSPYWKQRLAELGRKPQSVTGVAKLAEIPAVGERDVSPHGDPAGLASLVVQATEAGFALHAHGPALRRALRLRVTQRAAYDRLVTFDTKPTWYVWSGLGFPYPLASSRADLDVIARAGARLWKVLGLTDHDALLSALPTRSTTEHLALQYAAMAAGAPALFPGSAADEVKAAARLATPTVLAVESARALEVLADLGTVDAALDRLHTVLLVGAPSQDERAAVRATLRDDIVVLAVHAPAGARLLWGECRQGGADTGLHTYPDLEVVQLVDPDDGRAAEERGEVVLTQLGMRGSALLRWRTGDLTGARLDATRCPACNRTVPRVKEVRRGALVVPRSDGRALDLRAVTGALSGRPDLTDWRVVVGGRGRDGRPQVVVHFATAGDPGETAVAAAADVRGLAGLLPTQFVAAADGEIDSLSGEPLTRRVLLRA